MKTPATHAQRWIWFLDVVFGAIVALGIEKYEPVVREAWLQGFEIFSRSLFVSIAVCSFVVYDIAVYHSLASKFPYRMTALGFVRFYLDLIMAFLLYILLVNAFQLHPHWAHILATVSIWHLAAIAWHLLARCEYKAANDEISAVAPHLIFIAAYWLAALAAYGTGRYLLCLDQSALQTFILLIISSTILVVSLFRWNQIIQKITPA